MTSETRTLIELTDVIGIEFECRNCKAKVLYPFQEKYYHLSEKCPNCGEAWLLPDPHRPELVTADLVKKILAQLHMVANSPIVQAQVRLSVSGVAKQDEISN